MKMWWMKCLFPLKQFLFVTSVGESEIWNNTHLLGHLFGLYFTVTFPWMGFLLEFLCEVKSLLVMESDRALFSRKILMIENESKRIKMKQIFFQISPSKEPTHQIADLSLIKVDGPLYQRWKVTSLFFEVEIWMTSNLVKKGSKWLKSGLPRNWFINFFWLFGWIQIVIIDGLMASTFVGKF